MWRQLPKDRLWNQVMRDYRAGLADPKVCLAEPKPGTVGSRSPAMTDYSAAVNAPERLLWRNRRFQPKSAFSRFPPVYKTSLERQLRAESRPTTSPLDEPESERKPTFHCEFRSRLHCSPAS
jgi:hypothetical protein